MISLCMFFRFYFWEDFEMNVMSNVKWMSFEQIQEAVKVKSGEMRKLDNRFLVRILIALPFIVVPSFFVCGVGFSSRFVSGDAYAS